MKSNQFILLGITLITTLGSCQEITRTSCELNVTVSLEDGTPIEGAKLSVGYSIGAIPNPGGGFPKSTGERTEVISGPDGKSKLQFRTAGTYPNALLIVEKEGFYDSKYQKIEWRQPVKDDVPWTANLSAILKPIKNPIAMAAFREVRFSTPKSGVDYGYDLEMGKLVAPYGEGSVTDLIFKLTGTRADVKQQQPKEAINFRMEIKCVNPDDGFVEFITPDIKENPQGSRLSSSNEAPLGNYIRTIDRFYITDDSGSRGKTFSLIQEDENKCYYFRIRTKRDEKGSITSCHYGKMYGPLELRPALKKAGHDPSKGEGGFFMNYVYFNPIENSRNVEFDINKNLNSGENVERP